MWDLTIPGNGDHDFYVLPAGDGSHGQYHLVDETGVTAVLVHNEDCPVTVYHYTDKKGWNGINGSGRIKPGDSKNGSGPFFTTKSPADLAAPNAFKKLGLTRAKSEYVVQFQVPRNVLQPLRGGRGDFIFSIPDGVSIAKPEYSGLTAGWGVG